MARQRLSEKNVAKLRKETGLPLIAVLDGRPPLGLRPERIAESLNAQSRLLEIAEAMLRYAEAGKPVPTEWCVELRRRILWLEG